MALSKRKQLQAQMAQGCTPPKDFRTCEECGEEYPYFGPQVQHNDAKTCPEWFTGTKCWMALRSKNAAGKGGPKPQTPRKQTKDVKWWRENHCAKKPACLNISKCLDTYLEGKSSFPLRAGGVCKTTE